MKVEYNNEDKIERNFSSDWWFNHMRSSQKAMVEYIEKLHDEIDRLKKSSRKMTEQKYRIKTRLNCGEIWYVVQIKYWFGWWTYGQGLCDLLHPTEKLAVKTIENIKKHRNEIYLFSIYRKHP